MSISSNKNKNMMAYWLLNQGKVLKPENVKRLSIKDVPRIVSLKNRITDSIFGNLDIYDTIYHSFVTFGIEDDDSLVGAVCFDEYPSIKSLPPWTWESWMKNLFDIDFLTAMNSKWIKFLSFDLKYTTCFLEPILQVMFFEYRKLEFITFAIPPGINIPTFLSEQTSRIAPKKFYSHHDVTTLGLLARQDFFKRYKIRKAVEEDNDDIVAVINRVSKRLRKLYGEYYISELLSRIEDSTRHIVVAEYNGYAVAVLIVNEEVNYDILNESFEVGPFHGFRTVHEDDEYFHPTEAGPQPSIVKEDSLYENLSLNHPEFSAIISTPSSESSKEKSEISEYDVSDSSSEDLWTIDPSIDLSTLLMKREETSLEYFDLTGFYKTGSRSSLLSTCLLNTVGGDTTYTSSMQARISRSSLSEIKNIRQDILKKIIHCPTYYGEPNAFALEVLVTEPEHDQAITVLLNSAFECYKDKNYCLMCVPSTEVSYNSLDYFVRVTPRNHSTFPHDLYVLHRNVVDCEINVRLSIEEDLPCVLEFLSQMLKPLDIFRQYADSVQNPDSNYMSLVMKCQNQVIGLAVISEHVDVEYLFAHYSLYEWVDENKHLIGSVGVLENLIIYPVFQQFCRQFLREIHRLADFSLLVYSVEYKDLDSVLTDRPVLNCIQYMIPVRPRCLPEYDAKFIEEEIFPPEYVTQTSDVFALFVSMVRHTGLKRIEINSRIVVIGTGDTATAFLETLVCGSRPDLLVTFNNIAVVSPHGLPFYREETGIKGINPLTSGFNTYHRILQMNLRINVNIVHGVLTAIKRKKKIIIVNEVAHVPYDYLVLFCGEQYRLPTMKLKGRKNTTDFPENFFTINTDNDAVQVFNRMQNYKKDFMDKKIMGNDYVIVYGKDLRAIACVASLIEHGIPTQVLALVEPNTTQYFSSEHPESSTLVFTDPEIAEAVNRIIENLGVRVFRGYVLTDWKLDENNKVSKIELLAHRKPIHLGCKFMFVYADKSISNKTHTAIQKAGLVFDGRLVIDSRFCTNDPSIFAAGSLTKYSRKYHAEYKSHIYYNAKEVGEKIGRQFREMLIPERFLKYRIKVPKEEVPEKMMSVKGALPQFRKPIITYCWLPGDVYYLNVAAPGKQVPVELMMASDNYGRLLITGDCDNLERQGYFKLYINQNQTVESICCLNKQPMDVTNLVNVWGKHVTLLNEILFRFKRSMINDLFEFFKEPFLTGIVYDKFPRLMSDVRQLFLNQEVVDDKTIADVILEMYEDNEWNDQKISIPKSHPLCILNRVICKGDKFVSVVITNIIVMNGKKFVAKNNSLLQLEGLFEKLTEHDNFEVNCLVRDSNLISDIEEKVVEYVENNNVHLPMYAYPNLTLLDHFQDLKCLDEIVDSALDDIDRLNIDSWIYPHKKFNETRLEHNMYNYQRLSYVNCLEMTLDRLYIILNLANKRMDTVEKKGNIYHPQKVTLGRCVQKFWEMFSREEVEPQRKVPNDSSQTDFIINRGIQTESEILGSCDSCTQANESMKDITEYISTNFENSLTKLQRDSINENIFNITAFCTTLKLTNSLKQDYHDITQEIKHSKYEIKNLARTISDLESDVTSKEQKIQQLTATQHQCHEEIASTILDVISAESYIITLEREKSDLQRNVLITKNLNNQVNFLQEMQQDTHKRFEIQMSDFEKDRHTQKCEISSLITKFKKLELKYDSLYGKYSKMCQMRFKLEEDLRTIVCSMDNVNIITDSINQFATHTTMEITKLNEKIKLLQTSFYEQTNFIDKICIKQKALIEASRKRKTENFGTKYETQIEIQGNPILDLTKQIEENDITIERLQLQNQKFRKIIKAYQNKTLMII